MKLTASLAPARAEIEAGVVARADQYLIFYLTKIIKTIQYSIPIIYQIKTNDFTCLNHNKHQFSNQS